MSADVSIAVYVGGTSPTEVIAVDTEGVKVGMTGDGQVVIRFGSERPGRTFVDVKVPASAARQLAGIFGQVADAAGALDLPTPRPHGAGGLIVPT